LGGRFSLFLLFSLLLAEQAFKPPLDVPGSRKDSSPRYVQDLRKDPNACPEHLRKCRNDTPRAVHTVHTRLTTVHAGTAGREGAPTKGTWEGIYLLYILAGYPGRYTGSCSSCL